MNHCGCVPPPVWSSVLPWSCGCGKTSSTTTSAGYVRYEDRSEMANLGDEIDRLRAELAAEQVAADIDRVWQRRAQAAEERLADMEPQLAQLRRIVSNPTAEVIDLQARLAAVIALCPTGDPDNYSWGELLNIINQVRAATGDSE